MRRLTARLELGAERWAYARQVDHQASSTGAECRAGKRLVLLEQLYRPLRAPEGRYVNHNRGGSTNCKSACTREELSLSTFPGQAQDNIAVLSAQVRANSSGCKEIEQTCCRSNSLLRRPVTLAVASEPLRLCAFA